MRKQAWVREEGGATS